MNTYEQFLQEGFHFEVQKRFTGRFSKNKTRQFHVQAPVLAVMAKLSTLYQKLDLPDEIDDIRVEATRQSRLCAQIVATAVVGNNPYLYYLTTLLAWYLYRRIDATKLNSLQQMIHALSNYGALINAIRYMSASPRTTQPLPKQTIDEDEYAEEMN